jgi:hypothetical protein
VAGRQPFPPTVEFGSSWPVSSEWIPKQNPLDRRIRALNHGLLHRGPRKQAKRIEEIRRKGGFPKQQGYFRTAKHNSVHRPGPQFGYGLQGDRRRVPVVSSLHHLPNGLIQGGLEARSDHIVVDSGSGHSCRVDLRFPHAEHAHARPCPPLDLPKGQVNHAEYGPARRALDLCLKQVREIGRDDQEVTPITQAGGGLKQAWIGASGRNRPAIGGSFHRGVPAVVHHKRWIPGKEILRPLPLRFEVKTLLEIDRGLWTEAQHPDRLQTRS